ncbi:hypothetical protein BH10PSE16_BH10PSE16_15440 [soil metagenome]
MNTQNTAADTTLAPASAPTRGRPRAAPALRVNVLKRPVKGEQPDPAKKWTCVYVSGLQLVELLNLALDDRLAVSDAIRGAAAEGVRVPGWSSYSAVVLKRAKRQLERERDARYEVAFKNNSAWGGV